MDLEKGKFLQTFDKKIKNMWKNILEDKGKQNRI